MARSYQLDMYLRECFGRFKAGCPTHDDYLVITAQYLGFIAMLHGNEAMISAERSLGISPEESERNRKRVGEIVLPLIEALKAPQH